MPGFRQLEMAQAIAMLRIEVNTGMRHSRGSVMKLAKKKFGVEGHTKKSVLSNLEDLYAREVGRRYGS